MASRSLQSQPDEGLLDRGSPWFSVTPNGHTQNLLLPPCNCGRWSRHQGLLRWLRECSREPSQYSLFLTCLQHWKEKEAGHGDGAKEATKRPGEKGHIVKIAKHELRTSSLYHGSAKSGWGLVGIESRNFLWGDQRDGSTVSMTTPPSPRKEATA